jgi:superfamily I DNA/RNA helicase
MAWNDGLDASNIAYRIAAAPDPRIRVIAGPGTGKSFAIKRRVARLLEEGVDPGCILAVTFTRVAAADLHRELVAIAAPRANELRGSTLHGLAMRILRQRGALEAGGRHARPLNGFELDALLADLPSRGKRQQRAAILEYAAAWALRQEDEPGEHVSATEEAFERALVTWLTFHRAMLVDELVPQLLRYLQNERAPEREQFTHLLVDEYQDLNVAEQTVIHRLGAGAAVCIVGDDDQSIYGFKHAHPEGIRDWPEDGTTCLDLSMVDCRRCPARVVDIANRLIAHNPNPNRAALKPVPGQKGEVEVVACADPQAEAAFIAERTANLIAAGVPAREIIVLVSYNRVARPIGEALGASAIPVLSYDDEAELDAPLARRQFALLKLLLDRDDRVALRWLIGEGSRNFRAGTYKRLRAHCEAERECPWAALQRLASGNLELPRMGVLVDAFKQVKDDLDVLEPKRSDLPALIDVLFPDGEPALAELRGLAREVATTATDAGELRDLMMEAIIRPDVPEFIDEVRIMSLHKSKGLSSPVVFIAGCVQGVIPRLPRDAGAAARALAEARRLFFVGITRVKAGDKPRGSLVLTWPQTMPMTRGGGAVAALTRSQFLDELGLDPPTIA